MAALILHTVVCFLKEFSSVQLTTLPEMAKSVVQLQRTLEYQTYYLDASSWDEFAASFLLPLFIQDWCRRANFAFFSSETPVRHRKVCALCRIISACSRKKERHLSVVQLVIFGKINKKSTQRIANSEDRFVAVENASTADELFLRFSRWKAVKMCAACRVRDVRISTFRPRRPKNSTCHFVNLTAQNGRENLTHTKKGKGKKRKTGK